MAEAGFAIAARPRGSTDAMDDPDAERDTATIQRVSRDKIQAFADRDCDRWAAYFVQDERAQDVAATPGHGIVVDSC